LSHTPESQLSGKSQRGIHEPADIISVSNRSTSVIGEHNQDSPLEEADEVACRCESPKLSNPTQNMSQSDGDANDGSKADSIGEEDSNMHQAPEVLQAHQAPEALQAHQKVQPSKGRRLTKKLRMKTLEAQVAAFRAWKKPHRTDERITPGVYRGFWKWLARCFTFYIPSWFLKNFFKMHDLRQRLAFRQKVLFCLLLAAIYALLSYFLIIQPIASCVVKVHIGIIPNHSPFCHVVRDVIYVYMGLGGAFMLLVAFCVARVRYTNRTFEEHDILLVMHIPCYNENESVFRKTIESCVESSYEKKRKLLFIVADGTVAAAGQKPTYRILLEDIFDHNPDLEVGIDNQARPYTSFDSNGVSDNLAFCCTGYFREVPYVVVVKVGRDDEQDRPKPGNRGKRDSQLLVYNFFHYVNYRRLWSPLFENLEFQMRNCLNIDARDAMYMLVVDCDTEVQQTGISYLVNQLQIDPKLIGACGYTGVSNPTGSFVASSQVFEYWLTHAVLKAVETMCSNVLVLSGCFTIYRLKWPNNRPAMLHPHLLEDYAGSYDKTLHEHNLLSIGEDRYLSTLAIRYFSSDCRLRYFSAATCTTTVPDNLSVLLDQRRRWTNSLIHCHFAHLNVLPFEASPWPNLRLLFVISAELFMVFILPLALPAGLVLAVVSVLLTNYAWAILLAFFLIPVALCILCNDWRYIPFYLPFFPMIAVFSIIIPLFSVWKQDNVRWGKTRGG
jgi:cellulose synthase/poly-beta-1,6-N-acetylglucosamine synthase-like glycosyltransferase